jgi:hypothetical protein
MIFMGWCGVIYLIGGNGLVITSYGLSFTNIEYEMIDEPYARVSCSQWYADQLMLSVPTVGYCTLNPATPAGTYQFILSYCGN